MKKIILLLCIFCQMSAKDTFTPINDPDKLPKSALELWQGYDARAEDMEVKIIEEWKTDEVTTRYLTYKVGQFKGANARVAAFYSFPNKPGKHPAFVWTHGGGQQAERSRSQYFAKQGFACIDVNWLVAQWKMISKKIQTGGKWILPKVHASIPKLYAKDGR